MTGIRRNSPGVRAIAVIFLFLALPVYAAGKEGIKNRIEGDTRLFTIEVRDAGLTDVIRALAQQSGLNVIIGEGIEGKVTLSFRDITFKNALEIILKAHGLGYTIQNDVIWVGRKEDIAEEVSMEIVRLNYSDPAEAVLQLKGTLSAKGTAVADKRTRSVIIRDAPENVKAAKGLLRSLDIRSAQVVIEARIVEANTNFTRQLGIQWGGEYASGRDVVGGSPLMQNPFQERNYAVNMPADTPTSGLGIILGNLTNNLVLDVELSAAENRGDVRILSRPRVFTLNNRPATIHSGLTFRVKLSQALLASQGAGTGGVVTPVTSTAGVYTGLQEIKTGIDLTVTPNIASDGFIELNIKTDKSDPDFTHTVDGIPGVTEKSASTHVLVRDGDTVVIGGLYKSITSEQDLEVPRLSRIPLLGWLFRAESKTIQNEELLVFITPRIVRHDDR